MITHYIRFDKDGYPLLCEHEAYNFRECLNKERLSKEEIESQLRENTIELAKSKEQLKYFSDLTSFIEDRNRWLEHTLDYIEKKDKISMIFIVNGEDYEEHADPNEYLSDVRDRALKKSHNTGRPFREWQIRDARGYMLPPDIKIRSLRFDKSDQSCDRLFLSLKIGYGASSFSFSRAEMEMM